MTYREEVNLKLLKEISQTLNRFQYSELKKILQQCVNQVPVSHVTKDKIWRPQEGVLARDASILYRSRENELTSAAASMKYPFQNINDISHVPLTQEHKIITNGRANLVGQSRFYCSSYPSVANIECLTNGFTKEIGDSRTVTTGEWKIESPLILGEIPFSLSSLNGLRIHNNEWYDVFIDQGEQWYQNTLSRFISEGLSTYSSDYTIELFKFFSDEFAKIEIKSDSDYLLSNYYADLVFNDTIVEDNLTIDGIIYPSVALGYQDYNLVLHPRAMSKLRFVRATQTWVVHHGKSGDVEFIPLETAYPNTATLIEWNKFKYRSD